MANLFFLIMIIGGIGLSLINGTLGAVAEEILKSPGEVVTLLFSMLGVNCLFSGLMNIAKVTGVAAGITRFFSPVLKLLFPELKKEEKALFYISMNIGANFLGLANAATPSGLAAMAELQRINRDKEKTSDSMCMFALLNTASVQLFPTSAIALLLAAGAEQPYYIVLPCFIATLIGAAAAVAGGALCRKR